MIVSLADALRWYESVRAQTFTMRRLAKKHWDKLPWDGELGRDEQLRQLDGAVICKRSDAILTELNDLCVLLLFSVFEAIVRERVLADVAKELPLLHHVALRHAIGALKDSLEHGSFARVLEPYKERDADLIEEVSQVRRYRNWVAHGRRGEQPFRVDPRIAYVRLQRFLDRIAEPR
jgi:hypothetical protein